MVKDGFDSHRTNKKIAAVKSRVANHFKLNPNTILTYDELMSTPKNDNPKWNVIVTPNDGDDAAFRKDVKKILLTQH